MLRRQARLRREYLNNKVRQAREAKILEKKDPIKNESHRVKLPTTAADGAGAGGSQQTKTKENTYNNDEYEYAGCEDPKLVLTTSHNPSARLKMFAKELKLVFPNCQRMNRGKYELKLLVEACLANKVTDFIIVHEHRGVPDNLIVCHLPFGPTAYFNISGVIMRHDIPDIGQMSEQKPHLIFHNFKTKLGERTMQILKHLFPVPKAESKRTITFANHDDYIFFRHHVFEYINNELKLTEVGPRFQLKLYKIKLGTIDIVNAANTEWVLRPYMHTAAKRRYLSEEDGWLEEEENDA